MFYFCTTHLVISLFGLVLSLSGTAERNRCNSQTLRSNYRGYLHVLKYLLFIYLTFFNLPRPTAAATAAATA